jgi:hypothetical protein
MLTTDAHCRTAGEARRVQIAPLAVAFRAWSAEPPLHWHAVIGHAADSRDFLDRTSRGNLRAASLRLTDEEYRELG